VSDCLVLRPAAKACSHLLRCSLISPERLKAARLSRLLWHAATESCSEQFHPTAVTVIGVRVGGFKPQCFVCDFQTERFTVNLIVRLME